jgi:acylphosphatase
MSRLDGVGERVGPGPQQRLDAFVRGRVQGVGFRYFVLREATYLELDGFVANERDGSVHVVAEGPSEVLDALLERLRDGPPASIVERVIEHREPARGIGSGFRVATGEDRGD